MEAVSLKKTFLPSLFTLFIVGFSLLVLFINKNRKKYAHIPGPPADGLIRFFFGNVLEMRSYLNGEKCIIDLFYEWSQKYGKVFKFQFFAFFVIITTDSRANKDILIEHNFPKMKIMYKALGYPYNERFLGRGLGVESDNVKWKHRRDLVNPAFNRQVLMSFISEFNSKGDIFLERIRSLADGKKLVTMFDELNRAALDVIASVAFGMNNDSINDPSNELNKYITEGLKGFEKIIDNPFIEYSPTEWSYQKEYRVILKKLRSIGRDQILNRIKLLQDESYHPTDLLSIMLKSHENDSFDIEEMVDDFINFFVAGQETTANTMTFCILELTRNPSVLKKLREELDLVFGQKTDVTYEDLCQLNYTGCVIKETLRLWSPVPPLSRQLSKDLDICGYNIPSGTPVLLSSYLCARNEEYFEEPLKFLPERFLQNEENKRNSYAYFPFSLGPRNCIGQNFAQIEMKIILSKLLKHFDFTLEPNQNFNHKLQLTLRPIDGTKCYITPRKL